MGANTLNHRETRDSRQQQDNSLDESGVGETVAKPAYVIAEPEPNNDSTGINGGTKFTFEPADFSGEWIQSSESDMVRFYVVDIGGASNVSVEPDNFCIKTADNMLFSLDPDSNNGELGSHSFSLKDRNLALAMNDSVEVIMTLQGKPIVLSSTRIANRKNRGKV